MKTKRSLLLALFAFVFFSGHSAIDAAVISFDPSGPVAVGPNQAFQIDVFAQEDETKGDLTSFGFYVDPLSSLTAVSFDGYLINPDYDYLGLDNFIDGFKNSLDPNAGETILLATLFFTSGNLAGTDTLYLEGLVSDFNGLFYELSGADINAAIDITVTPVPVPGSIWLIGSGLLLMARYRRKEQDHHRSNPHGQ